MFVYNDIIAHNVKPQTRRSHYEPSRQQVTSEWINEFVSSCDWVCAVDDAYINDNFNLYGLSSIVDNYQTLIKIVRGRDADHAPSPELQARAVALYGLIHARYLMTFNGAKEMKAKYERQVFGACPRVACNGQTLLPIGLRPGPGEMPVKAFCPCCCDVYDADIDLDGSFFGPYFPQFFLQALREEVRVEKPAETRLAVMGVPVDGDSMINRSKQLHARDV